MTWKCTCLGETALLPPEGVGAKLSQLLVRRGWESKAFFLLEADVMLGKPRLQAGIALNVELPVQGEVRAEEHLEETKSLSAHIMAKAAVGRHQVLPLLSQGCASPSLQGVPPHVGNSDIPQNNYSCFAL